MHKISSSIAYVVVCALACVTNVLLASTLATIVLTALPQTASRVRPLSRVELHLRAKANAETTALAAIAIVAPVAAAAVVRPPVAPPKMSIGTLVAALDSAETAAVPAASIKIVKSHRTPGAGRVQAATRATPVAARLASKSSLASKKSLADKKNAKAKIAKAVETVKSIGPIKPRGTKALETLVAIGELKALPGASAKINMKQIKTVALAGSQRLRLAETPGEMMFRGLLGRSS